MLFIDSSYVVKAGSDVLYLVTEVLTRLSPGVIVHIHDVFWPFEYTEPLVSESLDMVRRCIPTALVGATDPLGASNSSLWLRRT